MIVGIGTDMVAIGRMTEILQRHGQRFPDRILAQAEWTAYQQSAKPEAFLAKRFAAKEAAAKALGTGFRDGLSLTHIWVENDELGKPHLHFSDKAADIAIQLGVTQHHLSLSDESDFALAFVVLEKTA